MGSKKYNILHFRTAWNIGQSSMRIASTTTSQNLSKAYQEHAEDGVNAKHPSVVNLIVLCQSPPDKGKSVSKQIYLDAQFNDGFISFEDCRAFCMREEQAKKPQMQWSTELRCGDPSARPRALMEALLVGGNADLLNSPACHKNFRKIHLSLLCAKPFFMISRSTIGTMRVGILDNARMFLRSNMSTLPPRCLRLPGKSPRAE